MATTTFCDICEKEIGEYHGFACSIGAFKGKAELNVAVTIKRCGVSGVSRWQDLDICSECAREALSIACDRFQRSDVVDGKNSFVQALYQKKR